MIEHIDYDAATDYMGVAEQRMEELLGDGHTDVAVYDLGNGAEIVYQ